MEKVSDVLITEALLEYSAIGGHTNDTETGGQGSLKRPSHLEVCELRRIYQALSGVGDSRMSKAMHLFLLSLH